MLVQVRAFWVRDRFIDVTVCMEMLRTIAMPVPVKVHAIAPQPPKYVRAKSNQHDADRRLQRTRELFGDRMSQQDRGPGKDKEGQRMAEPPGQPVLDDIANVGAAGGDARYRRDMIGLQRMLHAKQKTNPQRTEHAFPDFPLWRAGPKSGSMIKCPTLTELFQLLSCKSPRL